IYSRTPTATHLLSKTCPLEWGWGDTPIPLLRSDYRECRHILASRRKQKAGAIPGLLPTPLTPPAPLYELLPLPPLMRRGNIHILTILGHRAPRDLDAVCLQHGRELVVGQRFAGVFFLNQLAHLPLKDQQWRVGALGAVCAFREEEPQLQNTLRRVCIFVGYRTAHRRRMHADLFGHFLDH